MRGMKDSGVEWIGEIPADWELKSAGRLFSEVKTKNSDGKITKALKFYAGTIIPKDNFDSEDDSYVAETILNYTIVQPNTIMINGLNLNYDLKSYRVGIVREEGIITSAYLALCPNTSLILPDYANYLLKGYETRMAFHNMGSGIRKTLGYKEFKYQPIVLPPLETQQRIAEYLDSKCAKIDEIISKQEAVIEKLKAYKQSLITEAVTKGLNPEVEMKDSKSSWFGMIPKKWGIAKIKLFATTCSGGTPQSDDLSCFDGGINWACSYDLKEKEIFQTGKTLSEKGASIIAGELQEPNSILIAMYGGSGTIGNSGILKCYARTNQAICSIHFDDNIIDHRFGFYQIKFLRKHWMYYAVGTRKDPNISQDVVRNMKVLVPPLAEQQEIAVYLDKKCAEIESIIERKQNIIEKLTAYKKSLIYEVVTGKKEV